MSSRTILAPGLALIACLGTAACGGGGDHVASVPAPPASSPTYDSLVGLNKNLTLQTSSAASGFIYSTSTGAQPGSATHDPKGAFGEGGVTISYDASSKTYTLHDGSTAISYADADKVASAPGPDQTPFDTYARSSRSGTDQISAYRPGSANTKFPQLTYTTFVVASHDLITSQAGVSSATIQTRKTFAIGGIETIRSDLPKTGTASYSTFVAGSQAAIGPEISGSATITADFGAAALNTSLALSADGQSIGTFAGTAAIDAATSRFKGDMTANGATQGSFSGAFFGPQATEVGYTYRVQSSIGLIDGGVVGKK